MNWVAKDTDRTGKRSVMRELCGVGRCGAITPNLGWKLGLGLSERESLEVLLQWVWN